jgi:hypothetical protein
VTAFSYNTGVPAAPNNPSVDQPEMLINCESINSILAVDHVTFNTSGTGTPGSSGGQHLQVTFNGKNVPSGLPTDPLSIIYSNSGTASTISQLFFSNQNSIFHLSPIRAWAYVNSAGVINASQSFNVSAITHPSAGNYNVTLTANAVSSANFAVVVTSSVSSTFTARIPNVSVTGTGTFTCTFSSTTGSNADPQNFSFIVLQI